MIDPNRLNQAMSQALVIELGQVHMDRISAQVRAAVTSEALAACEASVEDLTGKLADATLHAGDAAAVTDGDPS